MATSVRDQNAQPPSVLSLNYRYSAAWNEVNTRIAQRQSAVNIFVTLASAIVTILIAGSRSESPINPNLLSVPLPIISFVFGLLNYKHDKTIALLRHYLAACEEFSAQSFPALASLGYNSAPVYRDNASKTRKLHDYSSALLILVFNIAGLTVARKAYPATFNLSGWPIVGYVVVVGFSVWLVIRASVRPHVFRAEPEVRSSGA